MTDRLSLIETLVADARHAGADAAELNGVAPDYRQMFTPNGGNG